MKVVFLLTQSLESPSGLGRYWPLSKELVRLGNEVIILALHHNFRAIGQRCFIRDGVRVCYLGQMHVLKRDNRKEYFPPLQMVWVAAVATWRLTRAALQVSADVIHLGKPHPMNGIAGLIAHRLRDLPLYLDCDDYEAESNRFNSKWQQRIVTLFEDRLPFAATGITANTHFIIDRLKSLGYPAERIIYVPNGVDRQRFSDVSDTVVEILRRQLGLVDQRVVLYVGSLSLVSHAVDLLLKAFAIVQRAEPRTVLLLVGGGEDYEMLQCQAETLGLRDRVRFVGRVPPDQVPFYYLLADVSVDPVRNDLAARGRFPLKIVESLTSGTPVVTGDVGDRSALLACGGGLVIPPDDPAALSEALVAILKDRALQARLSAEALAVRERYYWDRLVHDFVRVYGKMV